MDLSALDLADVDLVDLADIYFLNLADKGLVDLATSYLVTSPTRLGTRPSGRLDLTAWTTELVQIAKELRLA